VDIREGQLNGRLNSGPSACSGCTNSFNFKGGSGLNDGQWHHVAVVFDATSATRQGSMSMWIDGALIANEDFLPNNKYAPNQDYNHSDPLRIARAFLDPSTFFQGAMDDIRVYNRALSADEIAALATADCN